MATVSNHEFKLLWPHGAQHQSGSLVTFSCHLSPEISAVNMEIRWFKETHCVCLYKNRQVIKGRGYEDRVSLSTQELDRGNISLQLKEHTELDLGRYLCQVTDGNRTEELALGVLMNMDIDCLQPSVYISEIDKEWTQEEQNRMQESALLIEYKTEIERLGDDLKEKNSKLEKTKEELRTTKMNLNSMTKSLENIDRRLKETKRQTEDKDVELKNREEIISKKDALLKDTNTQLENTTKKLQEMERTLHEREQQLKRKDTQIQEAQIQVEDIKKIIVEKDKELNGKNEQLKAKDTLLKEHLENKEKDTHPDTSSPLKKRNSIEGLPPKMGGESSTQDSSLSVPVPELRLVLLGRMGSGKSTAKNAILGSEKSQAPTSSSTQQSESTQREVAGRKVTVVDTPDWFYPGLSVEKLRQDVEHCVRLSAPGPHAFLLVIPVKQPTGEERGMLGKMEEMFGERCWRNTVMLFTVTDDLQQKNIEKFIQSGDQEVQRLVEKCGNRFHSLNIKESGDGSQVSELLEKIEEMVEGSREKFYSSEIYLETESQIKAMETKILKEREEKRMREEKEMKEKIETEVQASMRKIEGVIQEHEGDIRQLNDRTTELERKMKEERDEEKKKELERELQREVERRTEMEEKVKKLREKRERERREMEEKHQREMEEIREVYEGEVRMEAERNLMKIIMPELQRNILASKTKMQEEFSRQMEEKNRELETLKQKLSELTETYSLLVEVYENTVRSSSETERAAPTGETSKGISQRFRDFFH